LSISEKQPQVYCLTPRLSSANPWLINASIYMVVAKLWLPQSTPQVVVVMKKASLNILQLRTWWIQYWTSFICRKNFNFCLFWDLWVCVKHVFFYTWKWVYVHPLKLKSLTNCIKCCTSSFLGGCSVT